MGIAYSEGVVKRGMTLERFADITSTNAAKIFGLYPEEGRDRRRQRRRPRASSTRRSGRRSPKDDFHVTDYSPWEGWAGHRLAGD